MSIKKHSLASISSARGVSNLQISYDDKGMWLDLGEYNMLIPKESVYEVAGDMVLYLSRFREDEEDLVNWLQNMLDYVQGE
jgi:hypothetical protein